MRERGWMISAFLLVAALVLYGRPQGVAGNAILILGAALSILALARGVWHPRALALPWVFVALAMTSALWSNEPQNSFTLAIALAVPLFIAGQIAANVSPARFLAIADWTLRVLVLASLVAGRFLPAVGVTQRDVLGGTLRGIYEHRNGMGFMVVLAIITLLVRRWGLQKGWFSTVLLLAAYGVALLWASSAGAIVFLLIGLSILFVARGLANQRPQNRGLLTIALCCFLVPVVIVVAQFLPQIFGLFGKDLTFTNRIYIWQGAIEAWRQEFLLGYGWANIIGDDDVAANTISQYAGYTVRSTHNGYLATALQLGFVGLVVAVLFLLVTLVRTARQAVTAPSQMTVWCFFVMVLLVGGDFVETRAFVNIGWFLLCVIAYYARAHNASPPANGRSARAARSPARLPRP